MTCERQSGAMRFATDSSVVALVGLRSSATRSGRVAHLERDPAHGQHSQQKSSTHCSSGLNLDCCSFFTSAAKTASAGAVESMQDALIEMTQWPPLRRKWSLSGSDRTPREACARVEGDDTLRNQLCLEAGRTHRLVGLRNVREDDIDHADEHAVLRRSAEPDMSRRAFCGCRASSIIAGLSA